MSDFFLNARSAIATDQAYMVYFILAVILLVTLIILTVVYVNYFRSFKHRVLAVKLGKNANMGVIYRARKKTYSNKTTMVESFEIFRFLKPSMRIPEWKSEHSTPMGTNSVFVKYYIKNDTWIPVTPDWDLAKMDEIETISTDTITNRFNELSKWSPLWANKSFLEKWGVLIAWVLLVVAFLGMAYFNAEVQKTNITHPLTYCPIKEPLLNTTTDQNAGIIGGLINVQGVNLNSRLYGVDLWTITKDGA